jgi:hypothetical protein
MITKLKENEVIVVGTNESGIHGAGAAYQAHKEFGLQWGLGFGYSGQSFGIPTKDWKIKTLPLDIIRFYIKRFLEFAKNNLDLTFLVTPIGTGLAGYTPKDIAPMFWIVDLLPNKNIILPESFIKIIKEIRNENSK